MISACRPGCLVDLMPVVVMTGPRPSAEASTLQASTCAAPSLLVFKEVVRKPLWDVKAGERTLR